MDHSNDCKSKRCFKNKWVALAFACLSFFTFSCDDDAENKEKDAPRDLRYASVSEVYEGKAMESAQPVVFSTGKTKFEITGGTAEDGGVYVDDEFQIVDTTGVVKLKADNQLIAGTYYLDLKVSNSAGETVFPKAFEQIVLPSGIEGLQYKPLTQVLVRGQEGQKTTVPVFKGSKPVTFALAEVSDFAIDASTGEITLSKDSQIAAGEHKLTVVTSNEAGEQTFPQVVRIDVQTLPYELVYSTKTYEDVQQKQAKQSVEATIKGTGPIEYSLKNDFGAFTINSTTGQVSLPANHTLAIDTYNLTVVATNLHGSVVFVNALSFEIIAIQAILATDLTYASATYTANQAYAFATDVPTVSGSTPTYSLADNHGAFVIDESTGVISLAEGNALALGDYPLTVVATNLAGDAIFTNVVTVTIKEPVEVSVFEDGWDDLTAAAGEKRLGNMIEYSSLENPIQADNNKWNRGWGNWTVKNQAGVAARGAIMIPQKTENDDWLIAESVDLTNYLNAKLNFAGYSRYGSDVSTLKLLVSEDYNGDVAAASWVEVTYPQLPTDEPSQDRQADLSRFDGKSVTVALRHESRLSDGVTLDILSRTHFILHFEVKAVQK